MQKLNGVIFDMDGLMFDTETISRDAWIYALEQYGHAGDPRCAEFAHEILGMNRAKIREMYEAYFGTGAHYMDVHDLRSETIDKKIRRDGVPVKPGLVGLLEYLQAEGVPCALATSTVRERALGFLKSAGVYDFFSVYICGDMVTRSKPDPEIFLRAADALQAKPSSCLVLEDSPSGLRAGLAAGCHVIAIPDLAEVPEDVRPRLDAVCETLADVPGQIRRLP